MAAGRAGVRQRPVGRDGGRAGEGGGGGGREGSIRAGHLMGHCIECLTLAAAGMGLLDPCCNIQSESSAPG